MRKVPREIVTQFLYFSMIGAIGTFVHYCILIICINLFSILPVFSSCLGFISGAITNYLLNYHFTFKSSKDHVEAITKFIAVALIGLIINFFIFTLFLERAKWNYLYAQAMATCIVLIWNFLGNRYWTFRRRGYFNE